MEELREAGKGIRLCDKLSGEVSSVIILSCVSGGGCWCVTYEAGFGLDDWIYRHLIRTIRYYRQL
jgi:hypothetical protein